MTWLLLDDLMRSHPIIDCGHAGRIFKGAKPGDLPIELTMRCEMAMKREIAKAMGFTVPQSILLSAERVIE